MLEQEARERIIVALDYERERALEIAERLAGHAVWLKVGMTLFYAEGPDIVRAFKACGFNVFLDLKFHDIPHQVRGAARSAALAGADLMSVHTLGSSAMLAACRQGADEAAALTGKRPKLLGITVLTSMDDAALAEVGVESSPADEVARLAPLTVANGIDGVVCSPKEAALVRGLVGPDALVVTPGVRPAGAALGDQSRVATPASAIAAGASHLVIGRPITEASDPAAAFEAVVEELMDVPGARSVD